MQVFVDDLNDNPPVFSAPSPLRLSILETTVPGDPMSTFQMPVATDDDGPANNVVGYRLQTETETGSSRGSGYFRLTAVNSSATESVEVRLSLARGLDREAISEHRVILVAFDSGMPALSTSLLVIVSVVDANDNRPIFDRTEYEVAVPETAEVGARVAVVRAVDADSAANGRVRYRFSGQARGRADFRLEERTGEVVVGRRLDFGRQSEYRLGVMAEDGGSEGLAAFAMLTVRVLDENNHRPLIDIHAATKDHVVDTTGHNADTFVALVLVTDDDGGDNGRVMCWLDATAVNETDHPSTDRRPGLSPDSVARPASAPPSSSHVNRKQFYGDVIAMAAAFDLVSLSENEYKIQLATNVTRSRDDITEAGFQLVVTCRDFGLPVAMTSSVALRVVVRHDADAVAPGVTPSTPAGKAHPRFLFPAPGNDTVRVAARLPVGHVIAVVNAAVSAADVVLAYELIDGNGSSYFDVDRASGAVILSRPLPPDNATFTLVLGVAGASSDNISVFKLAELYVVVTWTDWPFPVATTATSFRVGWHRRWSVWLADQNWSVVVLVLVVSCSLVLGTVLFAAIFIVCRKSRRGEWMTLRRRRGGGRHKLTSSYHMSVEFRACSEDGLNNVASIPTSNHSPATAVIGS